MTIIAELKRKNNEVLRQGFIDTVTVMDVGTLVRTDGGVEVFLPTALIQLLAEFVPDQTYISPKPLQ